MDIRARLGSLGWTRRRVLAGAALGGGLAVAWWLWPRRWPDPLLLAEGEQGFGGWIKIDREGIVTVAVPQLEMGQGVTTIFAEVVATELGADWRQLAVEMAPPAELYANAPLAARWASMWSTLPVEPAAAASDRVTNFARSQRFCATADGTSLAAFEGPLRDAAAVARGMLVSAAAEIWDVAPEQCEVSAGAVRNGGRRLPFGTLVDRAAQGDQPDPPPLRSEPARGDLRADEGDPTASNPRIDLPAKVDGSFAFAADIRLPGMVFASIRQAPYGDYELVRFDESALAGRRGVRGVVRSKRWLAVAADNWWIAEQALHDMRPVFAGPRGADSGPMEAQLEAGLDREDSESIIEIGSAAERLLRPDFSARYRVAACAHASLETASATARYVDGQLELWIAAQSPEHARAAAAKAVGLSPRDVALIPVAAGGSFDARLEARHAIEVAQLAKELGRPVQLTWPRANEFQAVPPRTPVMAELSAGFVPGSGGQIDAWRTRIAAPASAREFGYRLFDNMTPQAAIDASAGLADTLVCEGAVPPYGIANVLVEHAPVRLPLPTGRLRGNAPAYTGFFTECFVDELAERAGRDAYLYRMGMLGRSPRMAAVLGAATRLAAWDGGGRGSKQGLAMIRMGDPDSGGRIACVAEASLSTGRVSVERLSVAVDIGRIVNVDIARQQIEGGLLFGMAQAIGSALAFEEGKPLQRSLRDMALPTLASAPQIVVEFIASDAAPFDPGELGVAVAPPAIANALHAATGRRFRSLPFISETP